jgi:hypothetical protein
MIAELRLFCVIDVRRRRIVLGLSVSLADVIQFATKAAPSAYGEALMK